MRRIAEKNRVGWIAAALVLVASVPASTASGAASASVVSAATFRSRPASKFTDHLSPASLAWDSINPPANFPHRHCHACAWDPVHDMIYMYGGQSVTFHDTASAA